MKNFSYKTKELQKRTLETPNTPNKRRFRLSARFLPLLVCFAVAFPVFLCRFADYTLPDVRATKDGISIPAWKVLPYDLPKYYTISPWEYRTFQPLFRGIPGLRYEGRIYWPYSQAIDRSRLQLDETTIDLTYQGKQYLAYGIQGIDPSVMLYTEDTPYSCFVHNNDLTLHTGADLFETRIPLLGRYTDAYFFYDFPLEAEDSYYNYGTESKQTFFIRNEYHPLLDRFLEALNAAPAMRIEDTPLWQRFQSGIKTACPLSLKLDNGVIVILYLYEGGYVCAENFWGVCFPLEPEDFSAILSLLTDRNAYLPVNSVYEEAPACLDYATCRLHKSFGRLLPSSPLASLDTPEAALSYDIPSYSYEGERNPNTGERRQANEVWMTYSAGSDPVSSPHYTLTISDAKDSGHTHWGYLETPPLLTLETLSPETIAAFQDASSESTSLEGSSFADPASDDSSADTSVPETNWPGSLFGSSFQNSEARIWFGVRVHGRIYTLSSSGLDAKTAYEIMKAILP